MGSEDKVYMVIVSKKLGQQIPHMASGLFRLNNNRNTQQNPAPAVQQPNPAVQQQRPTWGQLSQPVGGQLSQPVVGGQVSQPQQLGRQWTQLPNTLPLSASLQNQVNRRVLAWVSGLATSRLRGLTQMHTLAWVSGLDTSRLRARSLCWRAALDRSFASASGVHVSCVCRVLRDTIS
jgi:hypothetical protein